MKMSPDQLFERFKKLKGERHMWESHWQELADYIIPRKNEILTENKVRGRKKGMFLFDNTGMNACELLAGSLHSMLTNAATTWFELTTGVEDIDDLDHVREYLQTVSKQMHMILNETNFQTEVHEHYLDLCCFGTAAMYMQESEGSELVHFSSIHLAEIYVAENHKGMIEEAHRKFEWDARQIIQEFRPELAEKDGRTIAKELTEDIAKSYKDGDRRKYDIQHSVYRSDFRKDIKQPFLSQYLLCTEKERRELREGGFKTFPYLVTRWTKVSGETYGRSPGMNALPEIKTVNAMTKAVLKGAQKTVDPPVQVPDDGFIKPKHTMPGAILYYRAGSTDRIMPVFNDTRLDIGVEILRDRQNRIRESFFVDQLQLNIGPQMTATEVERRVEERNRFLGPIVGRQHHEFLRPLIERLFNVMVERGELPQPPEELEDMDLAVRYSSTIARAQRVFEGENLLRAYQASEPFLAQDTTGLDNINVDKIIKENWRIYGAPQKVLRTVDDVEAIRDARQEAQEAAVEQQQQESTATQVQQIAPAIQQGR
jgi:hypothetical protein